ncbi:hypothetical protein [Methanococcoides alaskense]|uniref:Uncharacterized protein n=1 Tax=Methanococcoides alaskense TaxID=325778 RepID=A0AA90TXP0_9EURY|nr:hypothetical protein [Methanococcoides alaskense]MDA0525181.1 hypothetical protein [Methanococcoides alaskense]MDR6221897.1 hypothetical protein [Methanococcoides alaskense]
MLGDIFGIFKDVYSYYKYWNDMKGKEIIIITHSLKQPRKDHDAELINQYFEIEGTIDDVMLLPAGFKLKNVKERYRESKYILYYPLSGTGGRVRPSGEAKFVVRETKEKIISFSAIEQLEFKDVYDESFEPARLPSNKN